MSFHVRRLEEERKPRFVKLRKLLALSLFALQPLYALGKKFLEKREERQRAKRLIVLGIALAVACSIVVLTFSLLLRAGTLSLSSFLETSGIPLAVDEEGQTNILILGQGNEDHDGIDLTDTIMVASLDPSTRAFGARSGQAPSVALLSLPRDLYFLHTEYLQIGKGKLNTFWRDERILLQKQGKHREEASRLALQRTAKEVGAALGIPIHYTVKVDFTAFEKIIDALGGIDLTVSETIHDTEFPGPNYTFETFHIDAGERHLDGATALKYARTRHTSSDFDRSARQQQIISAAALQARATGILRSPRKIWELLSILREHLETDLTTREEITLAAIGKNLTKDRATAMQLNDVNGLYGEQLFPGGILYAPPRDLFEGAFVLLPVSIPEFPVTWRQVQFLADLFMRKREIYLSTPRIAVLNAGAPEGSARLIARELIKFGFEVSTIGNFPEKKEFEKSFLARNTPERTEGAAPLFSSLLALPLQPLEASPTLETFGDLTIVLGKDFHFRHFQDALPPTLTPAPVP